MVAELACPLPCSWLDPAQDDADSQRLMGAAILGLFGDEVIVSLLDSMASNRPDTVS